MFMGDADVVCICSALVYAASPLAELYIISYNMNLGFLVDLICLLHHLLVMFWGTQSW